MMFPWAWTERLRMPLLRWVVIDSFSRRLLLPYVRFAMVVVVLFQSNGVGGSVTFRDISMTDHRVLCDMPHEVPVQPVPGTSASLCH
jgi:hypothetical protein